MRLPPGQPQVRAAAARSKAHAPACRQACSAARRIEQGQRRGRSGSSAAARADRCRSAVRRSRRSRPRRACADSRRGCCSRASRPSRCSSLCRYGGRILNGRVACRNSTGRSLLRRRGPDPGCVRRRSRPTRSAQRRQAVVAGGGAKARVSAATALRRRDAVGLPLRRIETATASQAAGTSSMMPGRRARRDGAAAACTGALTVASMRSPKCSSTALSPRVDRAVRSFAAG